jgi:hypothetical protein
MIFAGSLRMEIAAIMIIEDNSLLSSGPSLYSQLYLQNFQTNRSCKTPFLILDTPKMSDDDDFMQESDPEQ